MILKIISGGQTGADRTALDWAIANGIPHGGSCPKGRRAEDGEIPAKYRLTELKTKGYPKRTEQNVVDADGTVIITIKPKLSTGSKKTAEYAKMHAKPWLHIHAGDEDAPQQLAEFVVEHGVRTLNVAGPRESSEPTIATFVQAVLRVAFNP